MARSGECPDSGGQRGETLSAMPPVWLLPGKELAALALRSPTLATAVGLARWTAPHRRVDDEGRSGADDARRAAVGLGLPGGGGNAGTPDAGRNGESGPVDLLIPWVAAGEPGLVDTEKGTVRPGSALTVVDTGRPEEVLGLWWAAAECAIGGACVPRDGSRRKAGSPPATGAKLIYRVLESLYLISALEPERTPGGMGPQGERGAAMVPLPVLAASLVVPEGMEAPTDEDLEGISDLMMPLDRAFGLLVGTGLVDYLPVDPAVAAGDERTARGGTRDGGEDEASRYGMVRLTPLGVYGLRRRLLGLGVEAPAVGDLMDADAAVLLDALPGYPEAAAWGEAEEWLRRREPLAAARELLAASRGDSPRAPVRRLYCQQVLALLGEEADPALREVLDDRHLGGLARVFLSERQANDAPGASEDMVFWLTVDTLAAQLATVDDERGEVLEELVCEIPVVRDPESFFSAAWQVDHPATVDVLEFLGRLHPDRTVAAEARKAAAKARARAGR